LRCANQHVSKIVGRPRGSGHARKTELADLVKVFDPNPLDDFTTHQPEDNSWVMKTGIVLKAILLNEVWPEQKKLRAGFPGTTTRHRGGRTSRLRPATLQ